MRMWLLPIRVIAGMLAWLGQAFARDQQVKPMPAPNQPDAFRARGLSAMNMAATCGLGTIPKSCPKFLHS
jgi:hypothetical protein